MSKIHWTDETINPVVGCSKISAGCQNCYAENMARRLAAMGQVQYQLVTAYGVWEGRTHFVPSELEKPRKWKQPRTIFISSMGDLFHDTVNIKWQLAVMEMVAALPHHTFIMLTKRPENMKLVIDAWVAEAAGYLPNLVLGVSAEDQDTADARIRVLLQIPAAKRFVSLEPMIGPVDLYRGGWSFLNALHPPAGNKTGWKQGLDGVILGGESGPKARPLDPAWVRLVRDQCAGTAFMFKQWSGPKLMNGMYRDGFPLLDGRTLTELAWKTKKTP